MTYLNHSLTTQGRDLLFFTPEQGLRMWLQLSICEQNIICSKTYLDCTKHEHLPLLVGSYCRSCSELSANEKEEKMH